MPLMRVRVLLYWTWRNRHQSLLSLSHCRWLLVSYESSPAVGWTSCTAIGCSNIHNVAYMVWIVMITSWSVWYHFCGEMMFGPWSSNSLFDSISIRAVLYDIDSNPSLVLFVLWSPPIWFIINGIFSLLTEVLSWYHLKLARIFCWGCSPLAIL